MELLVAFGVVATFVAVVILTASVPLLTLVSIGYWMIACGLITGVPAGVGYHLCMHRGLKGSNVGAWWWSPVRYHTHLAPEAWHRVLPWFVVGVTGVSLSLAGCALLVVCLAHLV